MTLPMTLPMTLSRFSVAVFLLLVSGIFPALAQEKNPEKPTETAIEPNPESFPVLEKLRAGKKDLSYDYLGKRLGLDLWLLSGPGMMQVIYTSKPEDGAMVGGTLIGPDGKEAASEVTRQFMEKYPERAQEILITVRSQKTGDGTAKPTTNSPAEQLWQRLTQSGKIAFGAKSDAPILFALLDPKQPETHDLWAKLTPLTAENKITLYVLPLGLTTADSILEIATILGSKDPATNWEKLLKGENVLSKETPESTGVIGMKTNVEIAQSLNLRKLPFLVYRDQTGKIRLVRGMPKDWNGFTAELQGK